MADDPTAPLSMSHLPAAPFDELVGLEVTAAGPDSVEGRLEVSDRHRQPYGVVHGGVYCTMVESLASIGGAVWAVGRGMRGVVGVSNSTDFLRAHRQGTLLAVASPLHRGRTQQLWQVVVRRQDDGKEVARGQVRLQNILDADVIGGMPDA